MMIDRSAHTSYLYLGIVAILAIAIGVWAWYGQEQAGVPVADMVVPLDDAAAVDPGPSEYSDEDLQAAFNAPLPEESITYIEDADYHEAFAMPTPITP